MSNQHERPAQTTIPENAPVPERAGNNEHMLGLTTRLLLGGEQLNPARIIPEVNAQNVRLSDGTTAMISRASGHNRETYWANRSETTFDARVTAWKTETKNALQSLNTRLASDTDKQTRWNEVFSQAGIGKSDALTDAHMQTFYDRYFSGEDKESNISRFVEDMARKYITEGQPANYDAFYQDMDAISWIGNIFGDKISAILPSLIEARLMRNDDTKREEVARKANQEENGVKRVNKLTDGENNEKDLLTYLWTHGKDDEVKKSVEETPSEEITTLPTPKTEEQQPEPATEPLVEIPPQPDKAKEKKIEARSHASEVADFLFNAETGELTGEQFDLSQEYAELVQDTQEAVKRNPERFSDHTMIFSNLALAQIRKIAEAANRRDVELGFELAGIRKRINGKDVVIGAFVVPLMRFSTAQRMVTLPDIKYMAGMLGQMTKNTHLEEYFRKTVGHPQAQPLASFHIHQEPLGEYWRANPSQQDYETLEDFVRGLDPGFVGRWGVFTKAGDTLFSNLFATTKQPDGQILHNQAQFMREAQVYED